MKFIVDQPVSPRLATWLRSAEAGSHDAIHVRDIGLSRAPDDAIFDFALRESRVLITADLDFARIIALSGALGPGLILFRAGNCDDVRMIELLRRVLSETTDEILPRSVVVIDEVSIRIAALPIRRGV
ncbi:MAG: DUF5615 family PIN-like protein [Phycisphaerae bacterium]